MNVSYTLGLLIGMALLILVVIKLSMNKSTTLRMRTGGSAKLPCLANNHCPMGQACSDGFCSEGFVAQNPVVTDTSSCTAKECNGLNAPCSRKETPCPEGTFCQNNSCVNIAAPDQGEAYKQIGMILD